MKTFDLSPSFSDEEFKHWFLPQEGIIDAYVVVNDNKITGNIVLKEFATVVSNTANLCTLVLFKFIVDIRY